MRPVPEGEEAWRWPVIADEVCGLEEEPAPVIPLPWTGAAALLIGVGQRHDVPGCLSSMSVFRGLQKLVVKMFT
jgi:hypothetical protein